MAAKQAILSSYVMLVVVISLVIGNYVSATPLNMQRKYLKKRIEKLNDDHGSFLGLIAVNSPVEEQFFATREFIPTEMPFAISGRKYMIGQVRGKRVVYVRSGVGMRNAVEVTQTLLSIFKVTGIIHFGLSGIAESSFYSVKVGDVIVPNQFVNTGLWDWLNPNAPLSNKYFAHLDVGNYNVPNGEENNLLGRIGYTAEEYYSKTGEPDVPENLVWADTSSEYLYVAYSSLLNPRFSLEKCVNESFCAPYQPQVAVDLKGSTSNIFVDNAAYREFLLENFGVSSLDMESSSVVMTSSANDVPVIVLRGLSNFAGGKEEYEMYSKYKPLASINVVKAVVEFIYNLPEHYSKFDVKPSVSM